jgi:hypothetical protein
LERAITSRISIGIEYNYIDLESITVATPSAPPIVAAAAKVAPAALVVVPPKPSRIDPDDIHTVFARVTFRFGGEEPRHTPYK